MSLARLADRLFWPLVGLFALGLWAGRGAALLAAVALAALLAVRALARALRRWRFRRLARDLVGRHSGTLALRRRQEIFVDAYHNVIHDGWERERAYFVERTLLPRLAEAGLGDLAQARRRDLEAAVEAAASADGDRLDPAPEDGVAYERYCAARLQETGWRAHPTKASGDQGADVVAERDGTRLVLQCKRYGKPVGNAAVQEAVAARGYWSADLAAVVSNAGFTPAARRLAGATGVLLLHHDELCAIGARPTLAGRGRH